MGSALSKNNNGIFESARPRLRTVLQLSPITVPVVITVWVFFGSTVFAQEPASPPQDYAVMAPLAKRSLLLDGSKVANTLVVVGERGHILQSPLPTLTWQQRRVPTQALLTAVYFYNAQLGWAVGHDKVILRTTDGGETWDKLFEDPDDQRPLLDVWFKNETHGIAIGAYGLYMDTTDGGLTWTEKPINEEDDFHLNHIAAATPEEIYIAAEAGALYRSADGGATWARLPSPYQGSFFGVLPIHNGTVLVYGLRGKLFRSEDHGQQWRPLATHTEASLTDAIVTNTGDIIIVGLAGTVLKSTDHGASFRLLQQIDRLGIARVIQGGSGVLYLIGEKGVRLLRLDQ